MPTMGVGASAVLELASDPYRLFDRARPEGAVTVVTSRGIPEQVFADIGRVSSLEENWDTHGAPRVSPAARRRATELVVSLYRAAVAHEIRMPDPRVFVSSDGMIGLFWSNAEKGADLEVLVGENELEAAGSESGEAYSATIDADDPLDILALIHKHITPA